MKSKELLFELIKSLSKSEKRYFKIFTSSQKENINYLDLFNAIQKQTVYNEKELLNLFKEKDFIRQFSVAKNYLINLILKSLSSFHNKAKKSIELNNYLSEIEILYWKGLYKLAYKRINQAKKIASKFNMYHYLLMINYWDRRVEDYVSTKMLNESAVKETELYLKQYNLQMEMGLLIKEMQKVTRASIKTTKESGYLVNQIFNQKLMQLSEEKFDNFFTKVDYLFLKGVGNALLGNKKEEFKYKMRLLEFLEENPHQIKENPLRYSSALNNILLYYYFQGYPKEYPEYLAKLDHVDLKFHHEKAAFYDTKYNLEIGYYIHLRDAKKITIILDKMEEWYNATSSVKDVQAKMICEYNMALSYFYLKNYKKSLFWCNSSFSLFDLKLKKYRHDLATSILCIQFLIYYELKHFELGLKYLNLLSDIASTNNYSKPELTIIKTLKRLLKTGEEHTVFNTMKEIITNQESQLINLDKDGIVFWLESKKMISK